jgi:putative membrane protein
LLFRRSRPISHLASRSQIDVDYGTIALAKSDYQKVREFAQRMVTDHSAVQKSVIALAEKLDVKAEDSPTSEGPEERGRGDHRQAEVAARQGI